MDDYRQVKLKDITEIINGGTPSTSISEYWNGEIPWITPKDLSGYDRVYIAKGERNITQKGLENSSAQLLPKNTILFSSRAPIGYVAIAKEEVTTNQGFKNLICNPDIVYYKYLYYWLKKNGKHIEKAAIGSTFAEVSKGDMENLELTLPPLSEQKRIANILSSFDNKIEILKKENKILEDIAENIFKEWFVKYNFPNKDGKPYRDSNGKMIDSELGPIPDGWRVGKYKDVGELKNGINYSRDTNGDTTYRIVNTRDILTQSFIKPKELETIKIDYSKGKDYEINNDDILIVRSATPGKTGLLLDKTKEPIIYSGFIIRLRLFDNNLKWYIHQDLKEKESFFSNFSEGSVLKNINQQVISNSSLVIPTIDVIQLFSNIVGELYQKIEKNSKLNSIFNKMKSRLLYKLIK